jgi:hypothetical protein
MVMGILGRYGHNVVSFNVIDDARCAARTCSTASVVSASASAMTTTTPLGPLLRYDIKIRRVLLTPLRHQDPLAPRCPDRQADQPLTAREEGEGRVGAWSVLEEKGTVRALGA